MTNYQRGDRVRITTKNSMHTGKTGVVSYAYSDQESLLVQMDKKGNKVGFFVTEVEKFERVEVNLSSVEEDYNVVVDLTPEEAEGVRKFVAAAQESEQVKGIQFGPKLRFL